MWKAGSVANFAAAGQPVRRRLATRYRRYRLALRRGGGRMTPA
jgi:hypothetical protein